MSTRNSSGKLLREKVQRHPDGKLEYWRDISGYEGLYRVSDWGRVKSLKRRVKSKGGSTQLKQSKMLVLVRTSKKNKYMVVCLSKNSVAKNFLIHRLVLEAFVGQCPEGMQCCHGDGDPSNNKLKNLCWDTPKANAQHKVYHGTMASGWKCSASKTAIEKRYALVDLHEKCGYSIEQLSRIFAKPISTVEYLLANPPPRKEFVL